MESHRIAVAICVRDRPTELTLLLESLWHQTNRNFDVFILDDQSGTPIFNYHFLVCMINKLNDEGNYVYFDRTEFPHGVSKSRQRVADTIIKKNKYEYILRVDDDVILEPNYIEKLLKVINAGFDLASGVTPFMGQSMFKRESKFVGPIINRVILDKEGNFVFNGDDCGMLYLDEKIKPMHHFRSCALMKTKIFEKVSYNSNLTKHGFREEEILSFKMIKSGFKLGCNTGAIAWHLCTPSGGERFSDANELAKINEEVLKDFTKKLYANGDFIKEYNDSLGITTKSLNQEELKKSNNLIL